MTIVVFILLFACIGLAMACWRERGRRHALRDRLHAERAELIAAHETASRERARQQQSVLDSMVEGIVVLDTNNQVLLANRAAAAMFNFPLPATGRALLEAVRHHEIAGLATRLAIEPSILGHELRIDGAQTRFVQVNAVALRDGEGASSGAVLVFHDLTRLRELEGVRQDFVANVSHELRTPLSLIKGATETLMDGAKTDEVALDKLLAIIDRHADRLTRLIDDLLLLAKLDSGRMSLNLQPVALRTLAQEVFDDLMPRAGARSMRLENAMPPGLLVRGDADRLRQVVFNLVDNAIKYGRPSGVITAAANSTSDRAIEVCVRDDGPGIPPDAKPRIFERFYRIDKARSRDQGGTGLGLSIVKHVVQAHGGDVRVESEPGEGSAFYFTLPRP